MELLIFFLNLANTKDADPEPGTVLHLLFGRIEVVLTNNLVQ